MPDMKMQGSTERVKQLRAAAVRLRREVEAEAQFNPRILNYSGVPHAVAETLAILREVMELVDEHVLPEFKQTMHDSFQRDLRFYSDYHEVMR